MKNGDEVNVFERKGFLYDSRFPIHDSLKITNTFKYDKTLTFEYPGNYKYITSKYKYGMLVYETTAAPKKWADKANEVLDILFLPNEFNKEIFINAGVRPELIRVVPHGFNPEVFNRGAGSVKRVASSAPRHTLHAEQSGPSATRHTLHATQNRFTFLAVAMPQRRKGIDVLLSAFEKAFEGKKDVELVIKFPYAPGKSKYDLSGQDLGIGNGESGIVDKTIGAFNFKSKIPNVRFIIGEYSEQQMADLYRSADCFVLPSRAEGFGLVYLEALACGIPVIATGWGGQIEFLNAGNSLLVDYKPAPAGSIQYDNENAAGLMAEPSMDDLVDKLRHMAANHEKEEAKLENLDLLRFYWRNIAERMRGEMEK
jgi:glycosyltransferase involved in cell wall biosynthesis